MDSGANKKINLVGISKLFDAETGSVEALSRVDLSVDRGEFCVLVGPSGCGKSTMLRMIQGLTSCSTGSVLLDGEPVNEPSRKVGFVFQSDALLPWLTVMDNACFGLTIRGTPRKAAELKAAEYIAMVGLSGCERMYPHQLSGGMRQRVNLARALAVEPDVLLMDEPFSALDAITREVMQAELMRIHERTRRTILFVTHQIDEAVFLGDRVVVMSARPGRVKADLPVRFPRPRPLEIKRSVEFLEVANGIWELIRAEIAGLGARVG